MCAQRPAKAHCWKWSRLVPRKHSDAWMERLHWLGPGRVIIVEFPSRPTARIEAFPDSDRTAQKLLRDFGGRLFRLNLAHWTPAPEPPFSLRLSRGVHIHSSESPSSDPAHIHIPSGLAFGTGRHPTTAMCLRRLTELPPPRPGARALDVGCGSGILALVASCLGYQTTGIDHDPLAIEVAKANAARNPHLPSVEWIVGTLPQVRQRPFDLILANLYAELLIEAFPFFQPMSRSGTMLIVSGILVSMEDGVRQAGTAQGWNPLRRWRTGKWICMLWQRPA